MFIRLTSREATSVAMYVNANQIVYFGKNIDQEDGSSIVQTTQGDRWNAAETPEQILAMIEGRAR